MAKASFVREKSAESDVCAPGSRHSSMDQDRAFSQMYGRILIDSNKPATWPKVSSETATASVILTA